MASVEAAVLQCSTSEPPYCSLALLEELKPKIKVTVKWDSSTEFSCNGKVVQSDYCAAKSLILLAGRKDLIPNDEVPDPYQLDGWLEFAAMLTVGKKAEKLGYLKTLNAALEERHFLIGSKKTLADYAVWSSLHALVKNNKAALKDFPRIESFYDSVIPHKVIEALETTTGDHCRNADIKGKTGPKADEGKYVELPGAKRGEVVVRFPPEASGFLHIGHAKAAMLNQYYRDAFDGKLIMRFDDTNPAKETKEFENVILRDLELLNIKPDRWSRTSDYFDQLLSYCEQLLSSGQAYVDDTEPEVMKQEREQRKNSKCRNNDVATNMRLFEEMKRGSDIGQKCCVRIKMDMSSDNGCLRDPTIYRCKVEDHLITKGKYKVYPTYDFACPIVDSIEGVTHALRTTEYHDRDEQYFRILDILKLRKPHVYEYSRLNLMNTVMSKRKLTWLVDEGIVEDWSDPRLPTVRGILRRGMTIEGLKQFIVSQGSSRAVVMMDWNKLWAFNRKVIDPIAPRHVALLKEKLVPVSVIGAQEESRQVPKHPKNGSVGEKTLFYGPNIVIEEEDANLLKPGDTVTLVNWGNVVVTDVQRTADGRTKCAQVRLDLNNTNYKNTLKLTWLADRKDAELIPVVASHFDYVISKAQLGKDEDFKTYVSRDSRHNFQMMGEPALRPLRKGDIIQLLRKGFYICDQPYSSIDAHTGRAFPLILFDIPDGHEKELPTGLAVSKKEKSKQPKEPILIQNNDINNGDQCLLEIKKVGDQIRELKAKKADKASIEPLVNQLKELKKQFELLAKQPWTADLVEKVLNRETATEPKQIDSLQCQDVYLLRIKAVGDQIRLLKSEKADKETIGDKVNQLKALKAAYESLAGKPWSPDLVEKLLANSAEQKASESMLEVDDCLLKIKTLGDHIRQLKGSGAEREVILKNVEDLKALKAKYKEISGKEWTVDLNDKVGGKSVPAANGVDGSKSTGNKVDKNVAKKGKNEKAKPPTAEVKKADTKKQSRLGLEACKEDNFPEWYSQVITKSEMIEYYDISGCYIIRPWAFAVWEHIQNWFDAQIKRMGVSNCYFPIFVSKMALERESSHVEGFSPEVAWVTKSGKSDLAEPIAVRPTSETVMYPSFAKWVQSHRDLPMKINQWCNIVRWEFKHPTPFLRTREFLWQEGHSAFAVQEEAIKEVHDILDLYAQVYEDLLAVPVIKGRKTEKEKFAGADFTTTIETYISATGRAIQAATSHHLGQNFSKIFEIVYEHPVTQNKEFVYQNSWGLTTRTIGVFTMVHSDNRGLVLPPRVAKVQVIIVPCGITTSVDKDTAQRIFATCAQLEKVLFENEVRTTSDMRDNYSPGWKFNHWELKGVPVRLEVGPADLAKGQVTLVRRDDSSKSVAAIDDVVLKVRALLEDIQKSLFQRAKSVMDKHTVVVESWQEFCSKVDTKHIVMAPFCSEESCEDKIKADSSREESADPGAPSMGAKSLCIPFDQPKKLSANQLCIHPDCKRPAKFYTLFGRSY